jgi:hypothetical protein
LLQAISKFLKNYIENIHTILVITKRKKLKKLFNNTLFNLIDVGATGGMDGNWHQISDFCHYITFDPDPRAQIINSFAKHTNYNCALWSKKKNSITLYLSKNNAASTIFKFNKDTLSSFLNHECHHVMKSTTIW